MPLITRTLKQMQETLCVDCQHADKANIQTKPCCQYNGLAIVQQDYSDANKLQYKCDKKKKGTPTTQTTQDGTVLYSDISGPQKRLLL